MTCPPTLGVRGRASHQHGPPFLNDSPRQDRIPEIEVPDLTTLIETPPVPCRGRQAHLATLGHPQLTRLSHGRSLQGEGALCLVSANPLEI